MFKFILLITLILIALPFLNKAKDYSKEKFGSAKAISTTTAKIIKYGHH